MHYIKTDQDSSYFIRITHEHQLWRLKMSKKPTLINKAAKGVQGKINRIIPERVHRVITKAVKELIRGVLFGAGFTTFKRTQLDALEDMEQLALRKINFYTSSSAAEGAITGFGGFISSLADFPLWLSLKMKMLFEIANVYGVDINDYKERLYILHIFQLTFSSQKQRNAVFEVMNDWERQKEHLPKDIHQLDWRTLQLEYRDFIDLAKLIQLIPGIGALAGAYVNHTYTNKLGHNAMNAYRMRILGFK